jgi:hypothetical protein
MKPVRRAFARNKRREGVDKRGMPLLDPKLDVVFKLLLQRNEPLLRSMIEGIHSLRHVARELTSSVACKIPGHERFPIGGRA